jgi:broad specificity phosphatase PhoE
MTDFYRVPVKNGQRRKPMELYIFRHGDTIRSSNLFFRIFGNITDSHKLKILPKAIPALEKIGEFFKDVHTDVNLSSPYLRCVESTEIVGRISKKHFVTDERLREMERNGETFLAFKNRVKSFLDDIQSKNYSAVSICTHGAVMAALKHLLISGKFYPFQIVDYPSPGKLLIIKMGKLTEINFNKIP